MVEGEIEFRIFEIKEVSKKTNLMGKLYISNYRVFFHPNGSDIR